MHRAYVKYDIRTLFSSARAGTIVAMVAAAVMSNCLFGTATNLCEKSGRRCNPGQICAANQDTCININGCGDGIVSPNKGEVCDDGNTISGDGCSADCTSDESCGNGITDVGETCDDHNTISGDGCSANCILENCGDGVYNHQNGEECDTGVDTQACNGNGKCTIPRCGDGYTNTEFIPFRALAKEECDEGSSKTGEVVDSATCNGNRGGLDGPGSCRHPACGDNYLNMAFKPNPNGPNFEVCDTGGNSSDCNGNDDVIHSADGSVLQDNNKDSKCQPPRCGDGYVNPLFKPNPNGPTEACDMGMDSPDCNGNDDVALGTGGSFIQNNNKDSKCQPPRCGDGYVNPTFKPNPNGPNTEACDTVTDSQDCNGADPGDLDHHLNNIDAQCQVPRCGDGYLNKNTIVPEKLPEKSHKEQCDDGKNTSNCNGNDNSSGIGNCMKPSCGDGYTNPAFLVPPKFLSRPMNTPGEECDNGANNNDKNPDACRTDCRMAFCGDGVVDPGRGEKCDKGDPQSCGTSTCKDNCSGCN